MCATEKTATGIYVYRSNQILTERTLAAVLSEQATKAVGTHGSLSDHQGGLILVRPEVICAHVLACCASDAHSALRRPLAILVNATQIKMMRDYCQLAREHGIPRGVFTSRDQALTWLARQASMWVAQETHRRRESTPP